MKRTINEIYEIIKEEIEKTKKKLQNVKVFHYSLDGSLVAGEYFESEKGIHYYERIKAFEEIISLMEGGGVLEELAEKDKEIEELKTRVAELQDKDWYEACIKQLEDQNDKLIKERDEIQKELETSVDYWKNEVFKKIEVKVAELPNEKVREIRKHVCDEIKNLAHNYMEMPICENCGESFYDTMIKSYDLKEILDKIEKGEEK